MLLWLLPLSLSLSVSPSPSLSVSLSLSLSLSASLCACGEHAENALVPIANGYELRQGLLDVGVHCEMVVYTGYGHGITKPKSQRAVLSHNKDWFGEYCTWILGNSHPCAHFSDD